MAPSPISSPEEKKREERLSTRNLDIAPIGELNPWKMIRDGCSDGAIR